MRANTVLRQMLKPITMTPIQKDGQTAWDLPRRSLSVVAGARYHLQANRPLEFSFEIAT